MMNFIQKNKGSEQVENHNVSKLKCFRFGFPISKHSLQSGQALVTSVILFLIISTTISVGVVNPVLQHVTGTEDFANTRGAIFVSQSVNEDALYRLKNNKKFTSPSTLTLNGFSATATSSSSAGGFDINSSGTGYNLTRNIKTHLTSGTGASFNYGVQSGTGGVILENTSSIDGNLFSGGTVVGSGSNLIKGDVISAGSGGLVQGVHATSSVYAHTINNSTIDKDAYYNTISGSTVSGASHPNSADQATTTLPISDSMITSMEADATAGGVISSPCPYKIDSDTVLGPKKINCDLEISGNDFTLTLNGTVWVVGNVTIKNGPTIKVGSSVGGKSVAIIADNPSNRSTKSVISSSNSATFAGSGTAGSFVLLISQNSSAENGGNVKAITVANSVSGALLVYAGHGEILMQNSVAIKEVTAYRIRLQNSAKLIYETGLANILFTSGPSGGYTFDKWREVQ